jgi:hypothetical protein
VGYTQNSSFVFVNNVDDELVVERGAPWGALMCLQCRLAALYTHLSASCQSLLLPPSPGACRRLHQLGVRPQW